MRPGGACDGGTSGWHRGEPVRRESMATGGTARRAEQWNKRARTADAGDKRERRKERRVDYAHVVV